jgi:hypothetical protein
MALAEDVVEAGGKAGVEAGVELNEMVSPTTLALALLPPDSGISSPPWREAAAREHPVAYDSARQQLVLVQANAVPDEPVQ